MAFNAQDGVFNNGGLLDVGADFKVMTGGSDDHVLISDTLHVAGDVNGVSSLNALGYGLVSARTAQNRQARSPIECGRSTVNLLWI